MSFKIVVAEENLETLVDELKKINIEKASENIERVFYKNNYYTLNIFPDSSEYFISESSIQQQLTMPHYQGESYEELFDKEKYLIIEDGENPQVVSYGNIYNYYLSKHGFTEDEIKEISSYETLTKHRRAITQLSIRGGRDYMEKPKIEATINSVSNLIKENIDLFRKYIKINELDEVIESLKPKETKFSDMFKDAQAQSYTHKFKMNYGDISRYKRQEQMYNSIIVDEPEPNPQPEDEPEPNPQPEEEPVLNSYIRQQLESMEYESSNVKRFTVYGNNLFSALMCYLGMEGYKWQFQNLNVNAEIGSYPISHAPVATLYNNDFFSFDNDFDYQNKVFTIDEENKIVKYWRPESFSDEEDLNEAREVFPKLASF